MNNYSDLITAALAIMMSMSLLAIFVYSGRESFQKICGKTDCYILYWSSSAAIGAAFFFAALTLTNLFISDFRYSVTATVLILLLAGFTGKEYANFKFTQKAKLWLVGVILILWTLLVNMINDGPHPDISSINPLATYSNIAHSFRAGNIAIYIDEYNRIPRVSQNTGQSILTAIPALVGIKAPQFVLVVWQGIFLFILTGMVYSIYRVWLLKKFWASFMATAITLLSGTALSVHHIQTIDTESTILLAQSADVLLCLVFAVALLACLSVSQQERSTTKTRLYFLLVLFSLGVSFNAVGAHYILIFVTVILFQLIILAIGKKLTGSLTKLTHLIVFSAGSALGSLGGGMLTPKIFVESVFIPGVRLFSHPETSTANIQTFHFRQPYFNGYTPGARPSDSWYEPVLYTDFSSPSIFAHSLLYIAIPFFGLVLMSFIIRSKNFDSVVRNAITPVLLKGWVIFGIGSIISGTIVIGPYIWEVTRFFQFGIFIGIVCFSYAVFRINLFFSRVILSYLGSIILIFFSTFGTIKHLEMNLDKAEFHHVSHVFSPSVWRDGGRLSGLVRTNQVACGGTTAATKEETYFCHER
jgi:hypothetical protein